MPQRARSVDFLASLVLLAVFISSPSAHCPAAELTPESPRVKRLIEKGIGYLEKDTDVRLGGRCLVGLCHLKHTGDATSQRVVEAVKACRQVCQGDAHRITTDIYSTGIAIFFLCEVSAEEHGTEIEKLVQSLALRQKEHGGFGYPDRPTGDTSMTQYAVLGLWAAKQHGIAVEQDVLEKVCDWLIRTQDPSGGWGYQGVDPESYQRVEQRDVRPSLSAAGLGSVFMASHLLGIEAGSKEHHIEGLPAAFRRVEDEKEVARPLGLKQVSPRRAETAQIDGNRWFVKNDGEYEGTPWVYYYMYALERCMSFRELVEGRKPNNQWYARGVEFLEAEQAENGSWNDRSPAVDTAFAVLFLMRGTRKTIETVVSNEVDGLLLGGRGLPKNTSGVRLQGGVLIGKSMATSIEEVLEILEDPQHQQYDDAVRFPPQLDFSAASLEQRAAYVQRLRIIAKRGEPEAQVRAIEMLAVLGDMSSVPTFIGLFSDDDLSVTLAARDGLRRVSRKFGGFGLPDRPEQFEILAAAEKWRDWYRSIAPESN